MKPKTQTVTRISVTGQKLVYEVIGTKVIGGMTYLIGRLDGATFYLPA
jgi:hypothetical protein